MSQQSNPATLREALDNLYSDNHRWSTRPCETCAAITAATGISFGCDKMAGRVALAASGTEAAPTPAEMALEHDRAKVAECVTAIKKALRNYDWLITSRGSYEWNDDRWHEEFKRASENIWEAIEPMVRIAADWSNCPKKWEDVQAARSAQAAANPEEPIPSNLLDALNKLMLFYPLGPKTQYDEINAALLAVSVACLEPSASHEGEGREAAKPPVTADDARYWQLRAAHLELELIALRQSAAPSGGAALLETLSEMRCVADALYMNLKDAEIWNPQNFSTAGLAQLFNRFKDAAKKSVELEAALAQESKTGQLTPAVERELDRQHKIAKRLP